MNSNSPAVASYRETIYNNNLNTINNHNTNNSTYIMGINLFTDLT
jgi:hypothetical protein